MKSLLKSLLLATVVAGSMSFAMAIDFDATEADRSHGQIQLDNLKTMAEALLDDKEFTFTTVADWTTKVNLNISDTAGSLQELIDAMKGSVKLNGKDVDLTRFVSADMMKALFSLTDKSGLKTKTLADVTDAEFTDEAIADIALKLAGKGYKSKAFDFSPYAGIDGDMVKEVTGTDKPKGDLTTKKEYEDYEAKVKAAVVAIEAYKKTVMDHIFGSVAKDVLGTSVKTNKAPKDFIEGIIPGGWKEESALKLKKFFTDISGAETGFDATKATKEELMRGDLTNVKGFVLTPAKLKNALKPKTSPTPTPSDDGKKGGSGTDLQLPALIELPSGTKVKLEELLEGTAKGITGDDYIAFAKSATPSTNKAEVVKFINAANKVATKEILVLKEISGGRGAQTTYTAVPPKV